MGKAVFCVAALMALVFAASFVWGEDAFRSFALVSSDVTSRPWILVTHMFLHTGLKHFAYNAFALVLFGLVLEKRVGSQNFLVIFFTSGALAGVASALFYQSAVGASGAIMGIIGSLVMLRPMMVVWSLGAPMPIAIAAGVWTLFDLVGFSTPDNVAHAAHLAGLGLGLVIGLFLRENYGDRKGRKEKDLISDEGHERWEREYMGSSGIAALPERSLDSVYILPGRSVVQEAVRRCTRCLERIFLRGPLTWQWTFLKPSGDGMTGPRNRHGQSGSNRPQTSGPQYRMCSLYNGMANIPIAGPGILWMSIE